MEKLTQEQIRNINNKCPYNQGVFFQPSGIPTDIKEHVIYSRYGTGGARGGSCWGTRAEYYTEDVPKDHFKVLDIVLEELFPNISYLQYKKIDSLIKNNDETDREYYGNYTEWNIEYIILSDLISLLESF